MPARRSYEPHCPAPDCSGGRAHRLHQTTAEAVHMPADVLARRKDLEVLFRCSYCGFVWFQNTASYPGFEARPAGWYDNFRWPNEFHAVSETYSIRDQNTRWYWQRKQEERQRRRQRRR